MYAVIFKATLKQPDDAYTQTAARLRELARQKYGCVEFISLQEGNQEIAISYWQNLQDIQAWKAAPEHVRAQALGKSHWYHAYSVQVVEVVRDYHHASPPD